MPLEVIYGFAYLKKAAAYTNCDLGYSAPKNGIIAAVCDEILTGAPTINFHWSFGKPDRYAIS